MCGRFALAIPRRLVAETMGLDSLPDAPARYNIAPSQSVEAVHVDRDSGARLIGSFHWGLIPSWAKDPKFGYKMINARAETVFEKPAFRSAIRHRRCLIPAQGFYEWRHDPPGTKAPYFISPADGGVMALAGIFEHATGPDGQGIDSVSILTREALGVVRLLHDRMPLILTSEAFTPWLDPGRADRQDIAELLERTPPELIAVPVGTLVNSPRNDGPELLVPIGPPLVAG